MAESREKGRNQPKAIAPAAWFMPERPPEGYTQVVTSFATEHPEFQVHAQNLRDSDPLRFNHALHLKGQIPPKQGRGLICEDCHERDVSGRYFRPIAFQRHCQRCHSLSFDPTTPELMLPHGDGEKVRAFLRNLNWQYEQYGRESQGIVGKRELAKWVEGKRRQLEQRLGAAEQLEEIIFRGQTGAGSTTGRELFPGCVYCHTINQSESRVPGIVPPHIPERWMGGAHFNHILHAMLSCAHCHDAERSTETSDILLPRKAVCTQCHSQTGGARNFCLECHRYHNW